MVCVIKIISITICSMVCVNESSSLKVAKKLSAKECALIYNKRKRDESR